MLGVIVLVFGILISDKKSKIDDQFDKDFAFHKPKSPEPEKSQSKTTLEKNKEIIETNNISVTDKKDIQPNPDPIKTEVENVQSETVYWVATGKTYHLDKECSALARSNNILSGTIAKSGKTTPCRLCAAE